MDINPLYLQAIFEQDQGPNRATFADRLSLEAGYVSSKVSSIFRQAYSSTLFDGGSEWHRVSSMPTHQGRMRSLDRYLPDGSYSETNGGWWEINRAEGTLESLGAAGDGVTDDTAIFNIARVVFRVLNLNTNRTYVLGDVNIPSVLINGNGARIVRAPGAKNAIRFDTAFGRIYNVTFDQGCYLANGMVDPAKAGISQIVSSTSTTVEVASGHGARFSVGMLAMIETNHVFGVSETRFVTAISGDTLTLHRPFDGTPVVGGQIIADHPIVATGTYPYANYLSNCIFRNFVVGVQTGSMTLPSAGNATPKILANHFEAFVGVAIVQSNGVAADLAAFAHIEGTKTTTNTLTAAAGQTRFKYLYNCTPYMHRLDERTVTVKRNGTSVTYGTGYTVDTATAEIVLVTPSTEGDIIEVKNVEWPARGVLCDGQGGSVNGMGTMSNCTILGAAIGIDIVGGTPTTPDSDGSSAGVEYMKLTGCVIDTCSYATLRVDGTRGVVVTDTNLWFAPYSILIRAGNRGFQASAFSTTLMPSTAIHTPAQRPNRAEITVEDGATGTIIDSSSWLSGNSRSLGPGTSARITWNPLVKLSLSNGATVEAGTGSPEGVVTAVAGSLYLAADGSVWRKASGTSTTGWVQLASVA